MASSNVVKLGFISVYVRKKQKFTETIDDLTIDKYPKNKIIVTKKAIKFSHERNRIKRKIRHIIRLIKPYRRSYSEYVFIVYRFYDFKINIFRTIVDKIKNYESSQRIH